MEQGLHLLVIFGIASVCIPTGAALGHPGRNFIPLLVRASCAPSVSKSSLSIRSFSSFENLILAWADASSSQHRQSVFYKAITCENALTDFPHLASLLPILKLT